MKRTFLESVAWFIRCNWLNRQRGISVSPQAYVASSVKFIIDPDGFKGGGQIVVARNTRISEGVIIAPYGGSIHIGENVYIGPYCVLYGHGGLTIEKNTLIAAQTIIIPANHTFDQADIWIQKQPMEKLGIRIGEDVWLGCGVRILDGVSIGTGCVVAAGSVVTKSLDDFSVAAGVPAKVIKSRKS
jgi:acetyltransferase-like isoleucine patch superfamily enzyme